MNHTFTTKTWGGNKPMPTALLIALGIGSVLFIVTIIGAPIGIIALFILCFELILNMRMNCPSCKAKVSVFRNAKAFSCYNCQRVIVKKDNQWVILPKEK